MNTSNFVLNILPGDNISSVAKIAQSISEEQGVIVEFDFNGIKILINADSNLDNMLRTYRDAFIMKWVEIGPEYLDTYPDAILTELTDKRAAQQRDSEEKTKVYQEATERKVTILNGKIDGITLAVKNTEDFEAFKAKNTSPYDAAIIKYSDQWGRLMQYEMNNGKSLEEIAKDTSNEADYGIGITGYMYAMAVKILSSFWEFGEQLRVWHNKSYDYEGDGIVNPAVLNINC
jgi:hypothetical protein